MQKKDDITEHVINGGATAIGGGLLMILLFGECRITTQACMALLFAFGFGSGIIIGQHVERLRQENSESSHRKRD